MDRSSFDLLTAQIRNRLDAADIGMKYGHRGTLEDALANALALLWMLVREVDPAIFVRSARHIQPSANESPIPWWPTDLTGVDPGVEWENRPHMNPETD